jgi:stalled ribosome rescue protein Dom34
MTTDIIHAIEQKKQQLATIPLIVEKAEDLWVFNHLYTVLNHAKKIFETDFDTLIKELKEEVKDARKHD